MADLPLHKISETETKITLGWTPTGDRGYRFSREQANGKWSHTWDATRSQVTFSKDSDWYTVEALGADAVGQYTAETPEPPSEFTLTQSIADGQVLSVPVEWSATPNEAVITVGFYIDGELAGTEWVAPYVFGGDGSALDPNDYSQGDHVLRSVATAPDGRTAETSADVTFKSEEVPPPENESAGRASSVYKTYSGDEAWLDIDSNEAFGDSKWARTFVYAPFSDRWPTLMDQGWEYIDAATLYNPSDIADEHPEWILREGSADGAFLYLPYALPEQYAADIGHHGFQQWYAGEAKAGIDRGYGGIFCDDVNDGSFYSSRADGTAVTPFDPRTGRTMTLPDYRRYWADHMAVLRDAIPDAEIVHNSVFYSVPLSDEDIQARCREGDVWCYERGASDGGLTGGTGTWSFHAYAEHVKGVHALGMKAYHLSYAGDAAGTELNLAWTLLCNESGDYAGSSYGMYPPGVKSGWFAPYDWDLGAGEETSWVGGLWRRDFERGVALLNDPGAPSATVTLPYSCLNSRGQTVTSVTLAQRQGAVLRAA